VRQLPGGFILAGAGCRDGRLGRGKVGRFEFPKLGVPSDLGSPGWICMVANRSGRASLFRTRTLCRVPLRVDVTGPGSWQGLPRSLSGCTGRVMGTQIRKERVGATGAMTQRNPAALRVREDFAGLRECVHSAPCGFRLADPMGAAAVHCITWDPATLRLSPPLPSSRGRNPPKGVPASATTTCNLARAPGSDLRRLRQHSSGPRPSSARFGHSERSELLTCTPKLKTRI
jgi:hypothetical protein